MRRVVVYTRPLCLFCDQVTDLLDEAGVQFDLREATTPEEEHRLALQYGAPAYPIVVVDGAYLGGFTHIVRLYSEGRLADLRSDPPAPPPAFASPAPSRSTHPPRPPSWTSQMGAVARKKPIK